MCLGAASGAEPLHTQIDALIEAKAKADGVPLSAPADDAEFVRRALERRLTAEQLLQSTLLATDAKSADALRPRYVKAFANRPREPEDEVAPSRKAALFVLHDDAVLGLLKPKPGNLVGRAVKLSDAEATDALYGAVLSRKPSDDERAAVAKVLAKHPDKRAEAIGRGAWALLASMEFGVNHWAPKRGAKTGSRRKACHGRSSAPRSD